MARNAPITTMEDLQRLVPSIVKAVNADAALMRLALVNPLLLLEELGHSLTDELRPQAERRVRFRTETAQRLDALASEVFKQAGERFDIDSPVALARVLFEKLKLPRKSSDADADADADADVCGAADAPSDAPSAVPRLPPAIFKQPPATDALERLRDQHPVMPALLDYRRLDASEPRLAPRALYDRVRSGELKLPLLRAQARLKRGPTPR